MITKVEKLVQKVNGKKECNKHYLYSQIIKNERSKRRLTLAEMARGICSISYLCKFEKNMIVADEAYIRAIFERVNLDYNSVGKNIIEKGVENSVKAFLYEKYYIIEEYFEHMDDSLFNAQNYLIKAFYYLIKEQFIEFKDTITTIDNIKDTLFPQDVGVLLFLVIEYYIKTHQFKEANRYLDQIEILSIKFDELNWLIDEQQFHVGCNLKIYPKIYKYYYKIMINNNIGYPANRQIMNRLRIMYIETDNYFTNVYSELKQLNLDDIKDNHFLDVTYMRLAILLKGNMGLKVFDEIYDNHYYVEARFISLLMIAADYIDDENYINIASEIAEKFEYDSHDAIHYKFIKFMLIKFHYQKKHEVIDYLRNEIIPYRHTFSHFIYTDIYEKYYIEYLRKVSKYKEALSFYVK